MPRIPAPTLYPALPHGLYPSLSRYPSLLTPNVEGQTSGLSELTGEAVVNQPKAGTATVSPPLRGTFEPKF